MIKPVDYINNIDLLSEYTEDIPYSMYLDKNENYIGPSTYAIQALKDISDTDLSFYANNYELNQQLSSYHNIEVDCFAFANSFEEALLSIISTFLPLGKNIVTVSPTSDLINAIIPKAGVKNLYIPYKNKWIYPLDEVKSALKDDNTLALIISNPNEPTGNLIPENTIVELIEQFPDKLIILDEMYGSFSGYTNINLAEKYNNCVYIKSTAIDCGLAGLGFTYIISNSSNISYIKRKLPTNSINICSQKAFLATITDKNYIEFVANEIARARAYLTDEIRKLGYDVYRSYGNYILVNFGLQSELIYQKFKSNGIIVKNYTDAELEGHLRITIPTMTASEKIINLLKSRNTLVFQLDNVLFDVSESCYKAFRYTYMHFTGKTLSDNEILDIISTKNCSDMKQLLFQTINQTGFNFNFDDIASVYYNYYSLDGNALIDNEKPLVSENVLANLAQNYNLAICTNRSKQDTLFVLNKFGFTKYFSKIITSDDLPSNLLVPDTTPLLMIKEAFITDYLICFGISSDFAKAAIKFNYATSVGVVDDSDFTGRIKNNLAEVGTNIFIDNLDSLSDILEL